MQLVTRLSTLRIRRAPSCRPVASTLRRTVSTSCGVIFDRQAADHRISHAEKPANLVERDRRTALPLTLQDPFLCNRLECVVGCDLAREDSNPLLGGGIKTSGDLFPRFVTLLARCGDPRLERPGRSPEQITWITTRTWAQVNA
jgi:hypothetical protein